MDLSEGFRLGDWEVQPNQGKLIGAAGSQHVQPRAMDVLLCLLEEAPSVVRRDELLQRVWGARSSVSDDALTRCVADLRKHFGEKRGSPKYIETVPKRGYRLLVVGEPLVSRESPLRLERVESAAKSKSVPERSIAVLPFRNLSNQPDQNYFAEGITDEIITILGTVPDLLVSARTSSTQLRNGDVGSISATLGVRFVLNGTVKRQADHVRVNFQLIDGLDGYLRVSDTVDKHSDDPLAVQLDVAQRVCDSLPAALLHRPAPAWTLANKPSPEAHDRYLRGLYAFHCRDVKSAIQHLHIACSLDSNYANAHALQAAVLSILSRYHLTEHPVQTLQAAIGAGNRALQLDAQSSLAHTALGMANTNQFCWSAAKSHFQAALDLNPKNALTRHWYGLFLLSSGDLDQAAEQFEIAYVFDPLSTALLRELALTAYYDGRAVDAQHYLTQAKQLDSGHIDPFLSTALGIIQLAKEEYEQAGETMLEDPFLAPLGPEGIQRVITAIRSYRNSGVAVPIPPAIESKFPSPTLLGRSQLLAGNHERALQSLHRAYQELDPWSGLMLVDPVFDELRETPGGKALATALRRGK